MASYHIRINEKMSLGKSLVSYLQSIPQIVTFETPKEKPASKSELYKRMKNKQNIMICFFLRPVRDMSWIIKKCVLFFKNRFK